VSEQPLLSLDGIWKQFGGVVALHSVSLDVYSGQVHALVGENGAGKSTLIKIASGALRPDGGTLNVDGTDVKFDSTHDAISAGVATVYQEPHTFPDLTVAENIFMGRELSSGVRGIQWDRQRSRVREILALLSLSPDLADRQVRQLSIGEQQLISIAKALVLDAKVLILDEPSAILTDRETQLLFDVVRQLTARGYGIIYITHRLQELFQIATHITVLRDGAVVGSNPVADLTGPAIAELMMGRQLAHEALTESASTGPVRLRADRISRDNEFTHVSFEVRQGGILGLYGLIGSGVGEIAKCLYGVKPLRAGVLSLDGKPVRPRSPAHARRLGIGLVPADRKTLGIFAAKSLSFNVSVGRLQLFRRLLGFMNRRSEREVTVEMIRRLSVRSVGPNQLIGALSGGNQQKLMIARQLIDPPHVLILEEPSQGVDVGAKAEIHALIRQVAKGGTAVIVVGSDLPEILHLCHNTVVIRAGAQQRTFPSGSDPVDVLKDAIGANIIPSAEQPGVDR